MKLREIFGTGGRLRRGEKALARGRLDVAERHLEKAWARLEARRRKGAPDPAYETRALTGLVQVCEASARVEKALDLCRTARRLRVESAVFYELPARHALSCQSLSQPDVDDLVAWACWPGAGAGSVAGGEVEARLRPLLKPERRSGSPLEKTLAALDASSLGWSWPALYLAEACRRRKDWRKAARHLARAAGLEPSGPQRARCLWHRAHCLVLAGQGSETFPAVRDAFGMAPPRTPEQWRMAVRVAASRDPRFALKLVRGGLRQHPADAELLSHLGRLCAATGDWRPVTAELPRLAAAARGEEQDARVLRLQCEAAMRLRNPELALAGARRICDRHRTAGSPPAGLSAWAATVLAWQGALSSEEAGGLLAGPASPVLSSRVRVAGLWAAVSARDLGRVHAALDEIEREDLALTGAAWGALLARLALDLLPDASGSPAVLPRLLRLARAGLHLHLLGQGSSPAPLHTLALVNLALARACLERGAPPEAAERLGEALGAWVGLLQDGEALLRFARRRFGCYQSPSSLPPVERIRELATGCIVEILGLQAAACRLQRERLRLIWDLEWRAADLVERLGGLRVGANGATVTAGPLLGWSLGLHAAVRQLVGEIPGGRPPSAEEPEWAVREVRRLFSPLGPAATLLGQRQFGAVEEELERASLNGDPFFAILSGFVAPARAKAWREREIQSLRVDCALEASREVAAHVPLDREALRQSWQSALEIARTIGDEVQAGAEISEIAVGRARVLFVRRDRAQRLADTTDRRSNRVRRAEGLELMALAWELTRHPDVQGPLAEHLNYHAVDLANRNELDEAAEVLLHALEVNPSSRRVAENLINVILAQVHRELEEDPDAAGRFLLEAAERIRALDPHSSSEEIQRCLDSLAEHGSTPFFNLSQELAGVEEWRQATGMMIWCLKIAPRDPAVLSASSFLAFQLQGLGLAGDAECRSCWELLRQHLPQRAPALPFAPTGRALAEELNQRAVTLAHQEGFEEALDLLARAQRLDPSLEVVRVNARNIGSAWMGDALAKNDMAAMLRAMSKVKELLPHG